MYTFYIKLLKAEYKANNRLLTEKSDENKVDINCLNKYIIIVSS